MIFLWPWINRMLHFAAFPMNYFENHPRMRTQANRCVHFVRTSSSVSNLHSSRTDNVRSISESVARGPREMTASAGTCPSPATWDGWTADDERSLYGARRAIARERPRTAREKSVATRNEQRTEKKRTVGRQASGQGESRQAGRQVGRCVGRCMDVMRRAAFLCARSRTRLCAARRDGREREGEGHGGVCLSRRCV
jgi:hypothetical protein